VADFTRRWQFPNLIIEGRATGAALGERWAATFASRPAIEGASDLRVTLHLVASVPPAPPGEPHFRQGELLAYYLHGADTVIAHFPRYGQVRLDLSAGSSEGALTEAALAAHGVFEDLLAISLSPHLRRRGLFLLHAFAAQSPSGGCALIVGDIGAGKTTTGLALLHAGWKLLSNDSPMLTEAGEGVNVLAYPGLLSAYPDTLARFPELAAANTAPAVREKVLFSAEAAYPNVWAETAPAGAILFPQIEPREDHALKPLPPAEALRLILPHAIEQWDKAMIPAHLALLNRLVQAAPAYRLRLGPNITDLPHLIGAGLHHEDAK
jgi:hypothetical protein